MTSGYLLGIALILLESKKRMIIKKIKNDADVIDV